jgi:hypothetical protein
MLAEESAPPHPAAKPMATSSRQHRLICDPCRFEVPGPKNIKKNGP